MRSRVTAIVVLGVLITSLLSWAAPSAVASDEGPTVAQIPGEDPEAEGQEGQDQGDGEGASDESAETGASEDETEQGTSEGETGPPWTYQMARITLALLLLLGLGMGYLYYRLIVTRKRGLA